MTGKGRFLVEVIALIILIVIVVIWCPRICCPPGSALYPTMLHYASMPLPPGNPTDTTSVKLMSLPLPPGNPTDTTSMKFVSTKGCAKTKDNADCMISECLKYDSVNREYVLTIRAKSVK